MQKIKKLPGICNHEFKVAEPKQIFVVDKCDYKCYRCIGAYTTFVIVCQKCGKSNTHETDIVYFSKMLDFQEDTKNYSPTQQDADKLKLKMDLKLKELKYKYKINQE